LTKLLFFVNLLPTMVNERNYRGKLLTLLKEAKTPLSGEQLCNKLGISRVAVWKQIGRLNEMGYQVESSRKGYLLMEEPEDLLEAHLFTGKERFYCLQETGSTMDYTHSLLQRKEGASSTGDFVVTAEKQSAGRGRHNREWESARGGLFFTHSFASALPAPLCYRASMAALTALTEILREDYKQPAQIKWPNDIFVKDKKIIGLLPAFSGEGDRITRFNLGIGINVNNVPPESACSLSSLTGKNLSRSELMKGYLEKMTRTRRLEEEDITSLYNSLSRKGGNVLFELTHGEMVQGSPQSVDEQGRVILSSGRGIYPGECKKTQILSKGI
jgi:BirA family transcriptional regulator, biotin operon repressor / biotin---[acetyl-CoA-carboxylase] ligase